MQCDLSLFVIRVFGALVLL